MKKVFYLSLLSLFIMSVFSCTPEVNTGESEVQQACCGDDFDLPPKPPIGG